MRAWLIALALGQSLVWVGVSFADGDVRQAIVDGIVSDFMRWNRLSAEKIREITAKQATPAAVKKARQTYFKNFFLSADNKQLALRPTPEEIQAVLAKLVAENFPFPSQPGFTPRYPDSLPEAPEALPIRSAEVPIHFPMLAWYLPHPRFFRWEAGKLLLRKGVPWVIQGAGRSGIDKQEAMAMDPFAEERFYWKDEEKGTLRLTQSVKDSRHFEEILHLLASFKEGRRILDALTSYSQRLGGAVSAFSPLEAANRKFEVVTVTKPREQAKENPLRPKPVVWVDFPETSHNGHQNLTTVSFLKGAEFGHLLMDFAYAIHFDFPAGMGRTDMEYDTLPNAEVESDEGSNQTLKAGKLSVEEQLGAVHRNQQQLKDAAKFQVLRDSLQSQHDVYRQLTAFADTQSRAGGPWIQTYYQDLEARGIVTSVLRPVDARTIISTYELNTLKDGPGCEALGALGVAGQR